MNDLEIAFHNYKVQSQKAHEVVEWAIKELKDLSRASSLAVSSERDTTKDGEARHLDLDLFDENDELTEAERREWAARDKYDMRDGK